MKHFKELLHRPSEKKDIGVIRELGGFQFAPLVARNLNFLAELEITLLRPGIPGDIVQAGCDIDNRLKTLLDALTVPPHYNALPLGIQPGDGETPFFCVLDDGLITKLSVQTDRLLEATTSPSEVELMILVRTKTVVREMGIAGLDSI